MEAVRRALALAALGEEEESKRQDGLLAWLPNRPLSALRGKASVPDFDRLERGHARETAIAPELLRPHEPEDKNMARMHVTRNGNAFYLHDERAADRIVLCAAQVEGCFLLSQDPGFPAFLCELEEEEGGEERSAIATLRFDARSKQFRLHGMFCERCDHTLGVFSCGPQTPRTGERQLLLELSHGIRAVQALDATIMSNTVLVQIPSVWSRDGRGAGARALTRECLCPRSGLGKSRLVRRGDSSSSSGGGSSGSSSSSSSSSSSNNNNNILDVSNDVNQKVVAGSESSRRCSLVTRRPRYDSTTGSLRMKFYNNRVRQASSKNMVWYVDTGGDDVSEAEHLVAMQFGKCCRCDGSEAWSLDYRFPLSPIQAFACALSLFSWQGGGPGCA